MKIAGYFLIFLLVALVFDGVTGMAATVNVPTSIISCNNPATLIQCGTGSCIPTGSTFGGTCNIVVTFSPAFANTPKYASAQFNGCHLPECHPETQAFPLGSIVFQSDNGETWVNMPVAPTEVYGTNTHEVSFSPNNPAVASAEFSASCPTGSSSATATLRPQFSTDGGSTWTELAGNTGLLDINIANANCSFTASPAFSIFSGINPAASVGSVIFRVIGFNGGGIGDNVVLNNLELTFFGTFSEEYLICIPGISGSWSCITTGTPISKTQMIISITRMAPATSGGGTSILVNWIAQE